MRDPYVYIGGSRVPPEQACVCVRVCVCARVRACVCERRRARVAPWRWSVFGV